MSLINLYNAAKIYGRKRAVDGVNFCLQRDDHWAIVGESGCGKTTLAKMMMGLIKPDEGSIVVDANVQMVFQDPFGSLDPLWNVDQILKEALWQKRPLKAASKQKMEDMLISVGLDPSMLGRFPHEFSGGERQRIAIARALLASCDVLILDEALSALDPLTQKQIMDLLRKLRQEFKIATIFISHHLPLVKSFSSHIAVMCQGKIVESAKTPCLFEAPQHPYTRQLIQAALYTSLRPETLMRHPS